MRGAIRTKKILDKKVAKIVAKKCYFCPVDEYATLACHRIVPGEAGGKYTEKNVVVVCANCHNLIHDEKIKVLGKYYSTAGRWVVNYIDVNGKEQWL